MIMRSHHQVFSAAMSPISRRLLGHGVGTYSAAIYTAGGSCISSRRSSFGTMLTISGSRVSGTARFHSTTGDDKTDGDGEPTTSTADQREEALKDLESNVLYGLGTTQKDLADMATMVVRGELNLFPDYQRQYVWSSKHASRLIATVLCNRFVPPVVLHEVKKGTLEVVDGKQRLLTLLGFYMNRNGAKLPTDGHLRDKMKQDIPRLKYLSKLDKHYEILNGLAFDDLSEERKQAFQIYKIPYVTIPLNTSKFDVFEVYQDINSGGERLNSQQIRRAVYHGPYMKMIDELRRDSKHFHMVRDPKAYLSGSYQICKEDSDGEMILRAFAFRQNGERFNAKDGREKFPNNELEYASASGYEQNLKDKQKADERIQENRQEFERILRVASDVFGAMAFRKKDISAFPSPTMWDAKYAAIAELLLVSSPVMFTQAKDRILKAYQASLQSDLFSDERTDKKRFLLRKEELKRLISSAIDQEPKVVNLDMKRSFPREMAHALYINQKGLCGICKQSMDRTRLNSGDYAHIDHIVPHSQGGQTVPANAQLTHRDCNLSKGAKLPPSK